MCNKKVPPYYVPKFYSNFPRTGSDFSGAGAAPAAVAAVSPYVARVKEGGPVKLTCNALDAIIPSFLQFNASGPADSRPHITLLVMHQPVKMLYDPGSQVTLLRKSVFQKLCSQLTFPPKRISTTVRLQGANSSAFKDTQTFLIPFSFEGRKTLFPCIVADQLSSPAILGDDLIKHFDIQYRPRESATAGSGKYDAVLSARHSTVVAPNSDAVIEVSLSRRPDPTFHSCILVDAVDGGAIFSSPALYSLPNADSCVKILVTNFSPSPVAIPEGRTVGVADFIFNNTQLKPLDKKKVLEMCCDAVTTAPPQPRQARPRGP